MKYSKLLSNALIATAILFLPVHAYADSAEKIDARASEALEKLYEESTAAKELGSTAKAFLIFPKLTRAGYGIGGEIGEGVLRSDGETVAFYRSSSASVGWQFGIAQRSQVIMFMNQEALDKFSQSKGWKAGVDANLAIGNIGGTIEGTSRNPVISFVFDDKGLMAGLSLEGSKFSKIEKTL
jgi:lipid-binding SYLF domain-containing protein